jgi:thiosulfate/3-mercaptopyruvate sulfurtransferase
MDVDRSPLVSVEKLARWLDAGERPVIVDLRWYLGKPGAGRAAYDEGHLPGAIFLDLDDDLADPNGLGAPGRHPLPSPEAFRARMAAAGIGDGSVVVGYDDVGGWVAARLWWMLDNLGFGTRGIDGEWVGVLDGGIKAWAEGGYELSTDTPPPAAPAKLTLGDTWSGVIERDDLKRRLGSVTLLDARAAPRYRGEVEPVDPVAGHIPTAINAPFDTNLDLNGRMLGPGALRARFQELDIVQDGGPERDVVVSCGSGTSAAHHSLAMRVAGLPDPILYVGSYSDWSRSGEPIATGAEPGDPPAPASPASVGAVEGAG